MTRLARHALAALAALAAVTGCTDTDRAPLPLELGDPVVYETQVHPYVALRCGSLDCHGDSQRALRLQSEHGLRATDALRSMPVSPDELAANTYAFAALTDEGVPHLALQKGLAAAAGGMAHLGGEIWADRDAPGYQCLATWLDRGSDAAACAAAFAEVALPP